MSELNKGALSPKTLSMPFMLGPYKGKVIVATRPTEASKTQVSRPSGESSPTKW